MFLSRDNRYFQGATRHAARGLHRCSSTLDHERIMVCLETEARTCSNWSSSNDENASVRHSHQGRAFEHRLHRAPPLDELFCRVRPTPYRSLDFVYETHDVEHVLPRNVNFTVTEDCTHHRVQVPHRPGKRQDHHHEGVQPLRADDPEEADPYYAIINDEERAAHYERYRALTTSLPNFIRWAVWAEYRYYNMDVIIGRALALADELVG